MKITLDIITPVPPYHVYVRHPAGGDNIEVPLEQLDAETITGLGEEMIKAMLQYAEQHAKVQHRDTTRFPPYDGIPSPAEFEHKPAQYNPYAKIRR